MSTNQTGLLPRTTERSPAQPHNDELRLVLLPTIQYVLLPCVSLLGIVGNVTSIVILTRHGFRKCSNILLLYLAVSEIFLLIGINNFPDYIYRKNGLFLFSEIENIIYYRLRQLLSCFHNIGAFSTIFIPVLMAGERILVIFWPFKARLILNPGRAIFVLSCLYVVGRIEFIYHHILMVEFRQFVRQDIAVGVIIWTAMYVSHLRNGLYDLEKDIFNYLTGVIPISLMVVGCVVIGLKILQITSRRRQLTYSQVKVTKRGTTKTTRTLLSICVLYIVFYGFCFSCQYIEETLPIETMNTYRYMIFSFQNLIFCCNCIGDCLIYVSANSSLRKPSVSNSQTVIQTALRR